MKKFCFSVSEHEGKYRETRFLLKRTTMSVPLIKVLRLFWDVLRSEGVGPVGGVEEVIGSEVLLQVFLSLCTDSTAGAWTQPDRQTQSRESPWDGSEFIVRSKVSVSTRSSHFTSSETWSRRVKQGTEQQLSKSTQLHWTSGYVLSEFRCSAVRCSWFCWCSSPLNIHQLFGSLVKLQSAAPSPREENQNQNQHAAQSLSSFSGDASADWADSSHSHCVCKLDQHRLGSFYQPLDLFKNRWWRLECYP